MITSHELPIWITSNELPPQPGRLRANNYSPRARWSSALVWWLGCWLAAPLVFFTWIPFAHVLGAFGLFIAGPVLAYRKYTTPYIAEAVTGHCPACAEPLTLTLKQAERPPLYTYCPKCSAPLQISESSP